MHLTAQQFESNTTPLHNGILESLVVEHFEKAFVVFNAFVDDHRVCVDLTEGLFREASHSEAPDAGTIYGKLVSRIRSMPDTISLVEGESVDNTLCWLLKETSQLSYKDIAEMMDWDRDSVKVAIAGVRGTLLAHA